MALLPVSSARGQSCDALRAAADSVLTARHADGVFHGVAAVGLGDEIVFASGYGDANREDGVAHTDTTRFLIGSLTKQFTAALVLTLVRDGLVDVNAPLQTYLPDYAGPAPDRITTHHLLTHRSGLGSFANVRDAVKGKADAIDELEFDPGSQFQYSNAGYVLLGLLVEAVTGETYGAALDMRVLRPAGIAEEAGYPTSMDAVNGLAVGYAEPWYSPYLQRAPEVEPAIPFSAGMMYATAPALVRWSDALYGGRVLPDSLLHRMTTAYSDSRYGYGLFAYADSLSGAPVEVTSHGGGISGFTSSLETIRPASAPPLTIVVLDNTQSDGTQDTAQMLGAAVREMLREKTDCLPEAGAEPSSSNLP